MLVVRQRGRIGIARDHNLSIVELVTPEGMTHVLKEDWAKILPYFQDGTFDRLGLPIDQNVGLAALPPGSVGVTFHLNAGKTARGEINTARGDELFYSRILGILRGLFTEEFPTQDF